MIYEKGTTKIVIIDKNNNIIIIIIIIIALLSQSIDDGGIYLLLLSDGVCSRDRNKSCAYLKMIEKKIHFKEIIRQRKRAERGSHDINKSKKTRL